MRNQRAIIIHFVTSRRHLDSNVINLTEKEDGKETLKKSEKVSHI